MNINPVIEEFKKVLKHRHSPEHPIPTVGGVDFAAGELLYSLVRFSKPKICVETGCDEGMSTIYIAQALKDNGKGMLYTCDIEPQLVYDAVMNIERAELAGFVQITQCKGTDLIEQYMVDKEVDFAFLDSMNTHPYENVKNEFDLLRPLLTSNALVVLHDPILHIGPRQLYEEITDMNKLLLPFSDGIAIMRKR